MTNGRWILLSLALSMTMTQLGCATLGEEQCEQGRWMEIGLADGFNGHSSWYVRNHQMACSDHQVDRDAYEAGRREGLKDYCTPERGYVVGRAGEMYEDVCPKDTEAAFLAEYRSGRRAHADISERARVRDKIAEEDKRREEDKSTVGSVFTLLGDLFGTSTRAQLRQSEDSLSRDIAVADAEAPANLKMDLYPGQSDDVGIATLGATAGSLLGFGTGHAIQGRYFSSGFKFTALEAVALGGMIAGANGCNQRGPSTQRTVENRCAGSTIAMVGALSFLGLRIWEAIDTWGHVARVRNGYVTSTSLTVGASNDHPTLNLVTTF